MNDLKCLWVDFQSSSSLTKPSSHTAFGRRMAFSVRHASQLSCGYGYVALFAWVQNSKVRGSTEAHSLGMLGGLQVLLCHAQQIVLIQVAGETGNV